MAYPTRVTLTSMRSLDPGGACTGALVSIHFFEVNFPAEEAGGGWFHYFPDVPVVPTVSLAISVLINVYGNRVGVMPLN